MPYRQRCNNTFPRFIELKAELNWHANQTISLYNPIHFSDINWCVQFEDVYIVKLQGEDFPLPKAGNILQGYLPCKQTYPITWITVIIWCWMKRVYRRRVKVGPRNRVGTFKSRWKSINNWQQVSPEIEDFDNWQQISSRFERQSLKNQVPLWRRAKKATSKFGFKLPQHQPRSIVKGPFRRHETFTQAQPNQDSHWVSSNEWRNYDEHAEEGSPALGTCIMKTALDHVWSLATL
jgi:hypothetical protein